MKDEIEQIKCEICKSEKDDALLIWAVIFIFCLSFLSGFFVAYMLKGIVI